MELNPMYSPESIAASLQSEQLMLGPMHPGVLHPLTHQMILAQHQVLGAHLNSRLPHFALNQQLHPNSSFPANLIPGFQPNFSSPHNFLLSTPINNTFEPQFNPGDQWNGIDSDNDEELAEWKRDLNLKEKRILREKFGDNHPELVTEEFSDRNLSKRSFQDEPVEIENRFPDPSQSDEDPIPLLEEERDEERASETGQGKICYPSLPLTSSDEESTFMKSCEVVQRDVSDIVPGFITRKRNSKGPQINPNLSIIPPSEVECSSPPFLSPLSSPLNGEAYPDPRQGPGETHPIFERETVQFNLTTYAHEQQFTPPPHSLSAPNLYTSPPSAEFTWTRTRAILYPPPEVTHSPSQSFQSDLSQQREIKRPPASNDSSSSTTPPPYKPAKREISYPPGLEPGTSPKKQIVYPPHSEPKPERTIRYPPPREIKRPPPISQSPIFPRQNFRSSPPSYFAEREILYPQVWTDSFSPKSTPSREIMYPPRNAIQECDPLPDEEIDPIPDIISDEIPLDPIPNCHSPIEDIPEDDSPNDSCPRESTPKKKERPEKEKHSDSESDVGGFQSATDID